MFFSEICEVGTSQFCERRVANGGYLPNVAPFDCVAEIREGLGDSGSSEPLGLYACSCFCQSVAVIVLSAFQISLPFQFVLVLVKEWPKSSNATVPLVARVVWCEAKSLDIGEEVLVGIEHAEAGVLSLKLVDLRQYDSAPGSFWGLKEFFVEGANAGVGCVCTHIACDLMCHVGAPTACC